MRKRTLTLALVVFMATGIVVSGFAQGFGGPQRGDRGPAGPGMMPPLDRIAKQLELTDDQQSQLKALHESLRKETTELRNQAELLSVELRQLWRADELDAEKIRAKSGQLSEIQGRLHGIHTDFRLQMATVLTSEQRAKLNRGRELMRGRRGGFRGPRMERGRRGPEQEMGRRGPAARWRDAGPDQAGERPVPRFDGPPPRRGGWGNAAQPRDDAPGEEPVEQPNW